MHYDKEQMKDSVKKVLNKMKPLLQHSQGYVATTGVSRLPQRQPGYSRGWTRDGQPVCRQCKLAGHFARFCQAVDGEQSSLN